MSIFQNRKVRFLNKFPHIFVGEAFRLPFVYAKIFGRSKPLPYDSYKFQQNEVSVTTICFFFAYFLLFTKKISGGASPSPTIHINFNKIKSVSPRFVSSLLTFFFSQRRFREEQAPLLRFI